MIDEIKTDDRLARYYRVGRAILVFLLVIAVGLWAVNQGLEYFYRAEFLANPCELCSELNPNQSRCIGDCFRFNIALYPDGKGGWYDPTVPLKINYSGNLSLKN